METETHLCRSRHVTDGMRYQRSLDIPWRDAIYVRQEDATRKRGSASDWRLKDLSFWDAANQPVYVLLSHHSRLEPGTP